jgi:hypothetical protein
MKRAVMKLLVYGAGVLGSQFSVRLHEARVDVSLLARGERLAALRRHGVHLAERDSPDFRRVPVVEHPAGGYDLIAVCVRAHQVDAVLESLADVDGDLLFLLNWAAGAEPLGAALVRSLGRSVRCRHCRNGCSSSCCGASCGARRPCTAASAAPHLRRRPNSSGWPNSCAPVRRPGRPPVTPGPVRCYGRNLAG